MLNSSKALSRLPIGSSLCVLPKEVNDPPQRTHSVTVQPRTTPATRRSDCSSITVCLRCGCSGNVRPRLTQNRRSLYGLNGISWFKHTEYSAHLLRRRNAYLFRKSTHK